MSEERIIASVQSLAEFVITINGDALPRSVSKVAINVMKMVNKISSARIVFNDGDPSNGKFPLTDGDLCRPGNKITIAAGEVDQPTNIFTGIIIKQSLKIRNNAAPQLIVECRHEAIKSTIGRKSASFEQMKDSDVFQQLLDAYNFSTDIEASTLQHEELVQYNCTDWDFILSRAEAIGKVILTNDETITIKTPSVPEDKEAALSLLYGATIIELDAEMDSRTQYSAVKAKSWDMANAEIAETDAQSPSDLEEEGNLSSNELADVSALSEFVLQHPATLTADERSTWADAQWRKAQLAKIRGRAKFGGIATVNPGDLLELHGLGERFNGKAFVSGVRHDYDGIAGWKTQAQFGHSPNWFAEEEKEIIAPKAGGLLPGISGLHTGIITDNEDPSGEMRVRVKFPMLNPEDDGVWARIALADAGNERGLFFRPEIGDEVIAGFLYDDPRYPVILGMLHSSAKPAPLQPSNDNHLKGYTSREKLILQFDDDKKEVTIKTPADNKIVISDDKKAITIDDQHGNHIETNEDGITLNDSNGSEIVTIETKGGKIKIKGSTKVVVEAPQIELVENSTHPLVFGDSLLTYLNQLVQMFNTHMHPGELAMGSIPITPAPPVPPFPPATPDLLSLKVKTG